jgi:hypothetical protein
MKLSELEMHCDRCPIIDHCNNYEDTPPCSQPRFENVDTDDFKRLAESSRGRSKNAVIDDVYKKLNAVTPHKP